MRFLFFVFISLSYISTNTADDNDLDAFLYGMFGRFSARSNADLVESLYSMSLINR